MPPIPDARLEERILNAAQRLWRKRGENGLTLRGVAREAGTTPPTVYKRFRNKQALRLALAYRLRDDMIADVLRSSKLEETYRRYLSYAESHPREYELLRMSWGDLFSRGNNRPGRVWLLTQLKARFGGQAEDYGRVFDALFLLCHGTAGLLNTTMSKDVRDETRANCIKVCDKLIENVAILRE